MLKKSSEIFRKDKKKRQRSFSSQIKSFLIKETRQAFEKLKTCFIIEFLLYHFDSKCKFQIKIDVSIKIIDDVLCQQVLKNDD